VGITLYEPAPMLADERQRERAVEASGALRLRSDPALQAIVEELRRSFAVSQAAVSILHSDWQYLIAAAGLPDGPYSRRTSFCGHAIEQPHTVFCIPDAQRDDRFAGNPVVVEGNGLRFYAAAPLIGADHVTLGAVCVADRHPRAMLDGPAACRLTAAAQEVMAVIDARGAGHCN